MTIITLLLWFKKKKIYSNMNNKKCVTVPVLIKWTIYVTHFYFTLEGKKRQRVARLNAPFEPQYLDKTNHNSSWRVSCVYPKISNTYMHIKWVKCMASAPPQVVCLCVTHRDTPSILTSVCALKLHNSLFFSLFAEQGKSIKEGHLMLI